MRVHYDETSGGTLFMRIGLGLILIAAALPLGAQQYSVLVFSKTTGFRHSSIPNGIAAIQQLGLKNGFSVTATEDSSQFTAANLSKYKAVVFLNTTGTVLDADQKAAFESYLRQGGGYAGVHSASDTEYDWPFYGRLVCAYFHSHPKIQAATVRITDRKHPSTASLPEVLTRTDEWYNFRSNPRGAAHVLALVDESSYTGGNMGDHPVSWCHQFEGGRVWYTAMGHTEESYIEPAFLTHLLGGIRTAAGVQSADCSVTLDDRKPAPNPRPEPASRK
jgi:cytochrome c